jgi:hypothetical protein
LQNYNTERIGSLDRIRLLSGIQAMRAYFIKIAQQDRGKAAALIDQRGLRFITFFILLPELSAADLHAGLSPRSRTALEFCTRILNNTKSASDAGGQYPDNGELTESALKWIFSTGVGDDGFCNEYDQILDTAAALLTRTYHNTEVLPELVRLIFKRNRKERYIHDLVWALWGSCDPHILMMIADYLRTKNRRDAELANKLLKYSPAEDNAENAKKPLKYEQYLSWFRENQPYLFFTEESFHHTGNPTFCSVDLAAKYRCMKLPPQRRKPSYPPPQTERDCPDVFSQKENAEKILLARYSHRLHAKNINRWNKWMEYPIDKQLEIARNGLGGLF